MASVTDFLFQGTPPPSVNTYGETTNNIPVWMNDYFQGLAARANDIAGQPYQTYPGPRVAPLSQDQQNAWDLTRNNAGTWKPGFNQAQDAFGQAPGAYGQAAGDYGNAGGMLGQAGQYNPFAAGMPYLNGAQGDIGQSLAGQYDPMAAAANGVNGAMNAAGNAQQLTAFGAASPYLGEADQTVGRGENYVNAGTQMRAYDASMPWLNQSGSMDASGMASPYLTSAAQGVPGQIQDYMNPYQDAVVNRVGDLAARQLNEKLIPAIGDDFVRAGQYGSSRNQEAVGHALRDTQESALAEQDRAMQQGYTTAGQQYQTDAARRAQIGATTGQIGLGQQSNITNIGNVAGNMEGTDAGHMIQAGQVQGQLAGVRANLANIAGNQTHNDQATQLGAADAYTKVGGLEGQLAGQRSRQYLDAAAAMGNLGQAAGNQAYQTMQGFTNIGGALGTLGNNWGTLGNNWQGLGTNWEALGKNTQALGLNDAAALEGAGQGQRAFDQQNYDTAYQDFLGQRDYGLNMVNFMNGALRGVPYSQTQNTLTNGPLAGSQYGASPLNQLAGGLTLASALFKKDGGRVAYRDGGRVKSPGAYSDALSYRDAA